MKHKAVFLDRDGVINRPLVRDGKRVERTEEEVDKEIAALSKAIAEVRRISHDLRPALLVPGFVDTHVHFPQTRVIGHAGAPLLEINRTALTYHNVPVELR